LPFSAASEGCLIKVIPCVDIGAGVEKLLRHRIVAFLDG